MRELEQQISELTFLLEEEKLNHKQTINKVRSKVNTAMLLALLAIMVME